MQCASFLHNPKRSCNVSSRSLSDFDGSTDAFQAISNITNNNLEYPSRANHITDDNIPTEHFRNTKMHFSDSINDCEIPHLIEPDVEFFNLCHYKSDRQIKYGDSFDMYGFSQWPGRFVYAGYMQRSNFGHGYHLW